jgi:hypothetical protein
MLEHAARHATFDIIGTLTVKTTPKVDCNVHFRESANIAYDDTTAAKFDAVGPMETSITVAHLTIADGGACIDSAESVVEILGVDTMEHPPSRTGLAIEASMAAAVEPWVDGDEMDGDDDLSMGFLTIPVGGVTIDGLELLEASSVGDDTADLRHGRGCVQHGEQWDRHASCTCQRDLLSSRRRFFGRARLALQWVHRPAGLGQPHRLRCRCLFRGFARYVV